MDYEIHEVSKAFPQMHPKEFEKLVQDIKEHGQRVSILVTKNGKIVDGKHRYQACKRLKIEPLIKIISDKESIFDVAKSMNMLRNHLTKSQRGYIAGLFLKLQKEENAVLEPSSKNAVLEPSSKKSQAEMGEVAGVSQRTVSAGERVATWANQAVKDSLVAGKISLKEAEKTIRPKPEKKPEVTTKGRLESFLSDCVESSIRLKEISREIHVLGKELLEICGQSEGAYLHRQAMETDIERLKILIKFALPYAICPYCGGDKCKACFNHGWMPKQQFDQAPKEFRIKSLTVENLK